MLPAVVGGIVPCSSIDCGGKVTHHVLRRDARGLALLERPLYLCDAHRTEVARLLGVDTLEHVAETGTVKHDKETPE